MYGLLSAYIFLTFFIEDSLEVLGYDEVFYHSWWHIISDTLYTWLLLRYVGRVKTYPFMQRLLLSIYYRNIFGSWIIKVREYKSKAKFEIECNKKNIDFS